MNEIDYFLNDEIEPVKVEPEIIIDQEIKNRLWKLNDTEYENLKQSLINEGCRDALMLWNNILIDGHNRFEICKAFDIEYKTIQKHFNNKNEVLKWIDTNQLSRRNLLDWQRDIILGRLSKINKTPNDGSRTSGNKMLLDQQTLAKDLNVSRMTLNRNEKFVDAYDDIERNVGKDKANELASSLNKQDIVAIGKLEPFKQEETINKIISGEAKSYKDVVKKEQIQNLKEKEVKEITDKYDVIVIDPAWQMEKIEREVAPNQIGFDYPTMSDEEIKDFKLPAADNCHVFLWTTHKHLPLAFEVFKSWNVKYVLTMVWMKNGGFQPFDLPQYNNEFILYGRIGTPVFTETKSFFTCFKADRKGHSVKPEEFYETLRRVTSGKRIDIFNRRKIEGFDTYGNEAN